MTVPPYDFFISALSSGTGLPTSTISECVNNAPAVAEFVQDSSCMLLVACKLTEQHIQHCKPSTGGQDEGHIGHGKNSILLTNSIQQTSRFLNSTKILFIKTVGGIKLSECDEGEIQSSVITIVSPSNSNLFSTLRSTLDLIYAPLLENPNTENSTSDLRTGPKPEPSWTLTESAKHLIIELENELAFTAAPTDAMVANNIHDIFNIRTPLDEIHFWERFEGDEEHNECAKQLVSYFSELKGTFERICNCGLSSDSSMGGFGVNDGGSEVSESLDWIESEFGDRGHVEGTLYNVFLVRCSSGGFVYSSKRVTHLINVIGNSLCSFLPLCIADRSWLFIGPAFLVKRTIQKAITCLKSFQRMVQKLTEIDLAAIKGRSVHGKQVVHSGINKLISRLNVIFEIRSAYEETFNLLSAPQRSDLLALHSFEPFMGIEPLQVSSWASKRFDVAVSKHKRILGRVGSWVRDKLKDLIENNIDASPLAVALMLMRFICVLRLPENLPLLKQSVRALLGHIEKALAKARELLESMEDQSGMDSDDLLANIKSCKLISARVNGMHDFLNSLDDGESIKAVQLDCVAVKENLEHLQSIIVQTWAQEAATSIENRKSRPYSDDKLIDTSDKGMLKVNFDTSLVALSRQNRICSELGMSAPSHIRTFLENIEKQIHTATALNRVSSFYNSLEHQIIPSQKPMLLESLVAFENVLQNQAGISTKETDARSKSDSAKFKLSWSNSQECERFVDKIHKTLDRLKDEIGELRSFHFSLAKKTCSLSSLDLLTQKMDWMNEWENIENMASSVCQKYAPQLVTKWILHWNQQVYDVLAANYHEGLQLAALQKHIGNFACDLILDRGALSFNPSFSSLKSTIMKRLDSFIDFPVGFTGINDADLFDSIKDKHSDLIRESKEEMHRIFNLLECAPQKYKEWLNASLFEENHPSSNTEWSFNKFSDEFLLLDKMQKDIGELPAYEMVGSFRLGLINFSNQLRDQVDINRDQLLDNLQKNLSAQCGEIEEYLRSSVVLLRQVPTNLVDLAQGQKNWKRIVDSKTSYQDKCIDCKKKLELFNDRVILDTTDLAARVSELENFQSNYWKALNLEVTNFCEIISNKKDFASKSIAAEAKRLFSRVESFQQLWEAATSDEIKSVEIEELEIVFSKIESLAKDFDCMDLEANSIMDSCTEFEVETPELMFIHELRGNVTAARENVKLLLEYGSDMAALKAKSWLSFRSSLFELEEFCTRWKSLLKDSSSEHCTISTAHVSEQLDLLEVSVPTLKYCRGDSFREDHWAEILQGKLGLPGSVRIDNLLVKHFIQSLETLSMPATLQFVKDLEAKSRGEVLVRETLNELTAWYQTFEIDLLEHNCDERCTFLVSNWKQLQSAVFDKQNLLATLLESSQMKMFTIMDSSEMYKSRLNKLETILNLLCDVQRIWVGLEPIFLRQSLPSEHQCFSKADVFFRSIMRDIKGDPKISSLVARDTSENNLEKMLQCCTDQLGQYQKALNEFLEAKRLQMPRFYFVGDDDLLEILGVQNSDNFNSIQKHLKNLFQGVTKVTNCDGHIHSFESSVGEVVPLKRAVEIKGSAEDWISELVYGHKESLSHLLSRCADSKTEEKVGAFPSQVVDVSEALTFSSLVEDAMMHRHGYDKIKEKYSSLLPLAKCKSAENKLFKSTVTALILDVLHYLDVVDHLAKKKVCDVSDWEWQKQLRYYCRDSKKQELFVEMSSAKFDYTFEYQGNQQKLVYTPLTEKCFLNLTQALRFGFGGNPFGPAGTGKTESVKALGAALGRLVVVFNCDEGIDVSSMGRMFTGIVSSGAWGCFDEFNRLTSDQLSGISQQIQLILTALKDKKMTLSLLGNDVVVNQDAGIFVTLNPASKDYKGRSELPTNLKAMFRGIAMGKPNNASIVEATLFAEGFSNAKELSEKLVLAFVKCQQLLSKQEHYDWSLRALKSILQTACKLFSAKLSDSSGSLEDADELSIIVNAIQMNTIPKLSKEDTSSFFQLMSDVFMVGHHLHNVGAEGLIESIGQVLGEKDIQADEYMTSKIIQLQNMMDQRIGVIISGGVSSGKSTIWRALHSVLTKKGVTIDLEIINPKSMSRKELLGNLDNDTREWTDGVLISAARSAANSENRRWVICDGDLDPEWVEALNSVLDDNKLLTLPNGERICFRDNMNFLFETHDLSHASPATISRMGLIHIDEDIDSKHIISSWLNRMDSDRQQCVAIWINKYLYQALEFSRSIQQVVETTQTRTLQSALRKLSIKFDSERSFLQALANAFTNMKPDDQKLFKKYVSDLSGDSASAHFDSGEIFNDNPLVKITDLQFVLTSTAQKTLKDISCWVEHVVPFILVGPEGCGKESAIRLAFSSSTTGDMKISSFHCDEFTEPSDIILHIKRHCTLSSSSRGRMYRPRGHSSFVLLVKDVDLVRSDEYGTCGVVAFFQTLLTYGGFYDEGSFVTIEKTRFQIVFSISGKYAGRKPLCKRFTTLLNVSVMDNPDSNGKQKICIGLLKHLFSNRSTEDLPVPDIEKMANAMVESYESIARTFVTHCTWPLRLLCNWVNNLAVYTTENNFIECVIHEALKTFGDRLMNRVGQDTLIELLEGSFKSNLGHSIVHVLNSHFLSTSKSGTPTQNVMISSCSECERMNALKRGMTLFSHHEEKLDLFLHSQSLPSVEHALTVGCGHALLVGLAGAGRTSIVKLICFLREVTFLSPCTSMESTAEVFLKDLKTNLLKAGIENQRVCLFIEDHHICSALLVCFVSRILSAQSSIIFTDGELEPLLASLHDSLAVEEKSASLYELFERRIQHNFQIVFSLSPSNTTVITLQQHPAILRNCNVVHLSHLSESNLKAIISLEGIISDIKTGHSSDVVTEAVVKIHELQVHQCNACPADFYSLLGMWRQIYNEMANSLGSELERTQRGLQMLETTNKEVKELGITAKNQKLELQTAQKDADKAMSCIASELSKAQIKSKETEQMKIDLDAKTKEMAERSNAIEKELSGILPKLDAAKDAVKGIKREHLDFIRSLKTPPPAIVDVLSGVLMLLGNADLTWLAMKNFLGQRGVKDDILNFEAGNLLPQVALKVETLVMKKKQSFEPSKIRKVSVAAEGLAVWVNANLDYAKVLQNVNPLRESLDRTGAELQASKDLIEKCDLEIISINKNVEKLRENFGDEVRRAELVKENLRVNNERLEAAAKLLGGLKGEKDRWQQSVLSLEKKMNSLWSSTLIISGVISYLSGKDEKNRNCIVKSWLKILDFDPSIVDFDLLSSGATEMELINWLSWGLPNEKFYMENAVILDKLLSCKTREKVAYIVDPSGVSTNWLKANLAQKGLLVEFASLLDQNFSNKASLCVKFGKTLVVIDCEGVSSFLYPLIRREFFYCGSRKMINLGGKSIDFHDDFRLILVSRNLDATSTPSSIPSNLRGSCIPVHFQISHDSLETQIIDLVVRHDIPEVEDRRVSVKKEEEQLRLDLLSLENSLLESLSSSEGNLLECPSLVDLLTEANVKSTSIAAALVRSSEIMKELDLQSNFYRPVATAGADLFLLLKNIKALNDTYHFGISYFLDLLTYTLKDPLLADIDAKQRSENLRDAFVKNVIFAVGKAVKHEDLFTFFVYIHRGLNPLAWGTSWGYLTDQREASELELDNVPSWVPEKSKHAFAILKSHNPNVLEYFKFDDEGWSAWIEGKKDYSYLSKTNCVAAVDELLLVHALRPINFVEALSVFCCNQVGVGSLLSSTLDLQSVFNSVRERKRNRPILCICTGDNDPSTDLQDFAASTVGEERYIVISMGSGEKQIALDSLRASVKNGNWLCLKNLQLVTDWLPVLAQEYCMLVASPETEFHPEFQLWLTTEDRFDHFSKELLEISEKLAYGGLASTSNIQSSMRAIYSNWEANSIWDEIVRNNSQHHYALAYAHSLLQERYSFEQKVEGTRLNFNSVDLKSAELILRSAPTTSQKTLCSLLRDCAYGGKIEDCADLEICETYIKTCFSDNFLLGKCPKSSDISSHLSEISRISVESITKALGLPPNAHVRMQLAMRKNVTTKLATVEAIDIHAIERENRETWALSVQEVIDYWRLLRESIDDDFDWHNDQELGGIPVPDTLQAFFIKERKFGCQLYDAINTWLEEPNESHCESFYRRMTPDQWQRIWEGPTEVKKWLKSVFVRLKGISTKDHEKQKSINLSHLFHPEAFVGALQQRTANFLNCTMSELRQSVSFDVDQTNSVPIPFHVEGMHIQGAIFDGQRLSSVESFASDFSSMPPFLFYFIPKSEPEIAFGEKIDVPIFLSPWKKKPIMNISLPCADRHDKLNWVLARVRVYLDV